MSDSRILIEACVGSVADAVAAARAGADRIELNRSLHQDGLTPSLEDIKKTVRNVDVPVVVMLRPHARGFVYDEDDFAEMERLVEPILDSGAAGIVVGVLTQDGTVHIERMEALVRRATNGSVVFHRAFDIVRDPMIAADHLIDLGVTRVLTSGQRDTALEGSSTIRDLVEHSKGRLEVMPGSGIGPDNAVELVARTRCTELHGSFRARGMQFDPSLLTKTRAVLDSR